MKPGPKPKRFSTKKTEQLYTELIEGARITALAAKYKTSAQVIKRNLERVYGEDVYHQLVHAWKKEQTPWNFGKHGTAPWMKQYQYKKGHLRGTAARKWRPLLTVVIWKRAGKELRYIKIDDKAMNGSKNWIQYCHYIWHRTNGSIPKGMDIVHLDLNLLNDDIDNLMAMTRSDFRKYLCERFPDKFGIVNFVRKRRGARKLKESFYRARVKYNTTVVAECNNCSADVLKGTVRCPKCSSYAIVEKEVKRKIAI